MFRSALLCALLALPHLAHLQDAGAPTGEYDEAHYVLERLNEGLPPPEEPVFLQTPQAALEHFVLRSRAGDFASAAYALNLNLVAVDRQADLAASLAQRLYYLLDSQRLIAWDDVPDRPDAQVEVIPGAANPLAGRPRRSVALGSLDLDGRDMVFRLQRVRVGDSAPVWVFSPSTVENVPDLYRHYGPGPVDRMLPDWASARPFLEIPLWEWAALVIVVLVCGLIGWLAGLSSRHIAQGSSVIFPAFAGKLVRPVAFAVMFGLLFALTSGGLFFTGSMLGMLQPVVWILFIASLTWAGMSVIELLMRRFERKREDELDGYDQDLQRNLTVLSVARRVFIFLTMLIGFGVGLSQFTALELLGTALLTSAGIASVILGIAAQPVLSNIVAGAQVAVTQPVRIGDSVFIEDNWGYVEDLRYTFAVVRTWDERRLVLPLRYLVTETYENWTLKDAHLIKPIYLYADYRVDVQQIRDRFDALLRESEEWDGEQEPTVQVTSVSDEAIEIRALCSAKDPSAAWSLHCRLREELVAFVQGLDDGKYLPRRRLVLQEEASALRDRAGSAEVAENTGGS